jgi:nitrate/nitrite transport system substrate-binding protein
MVSNRQLPPPEKSDLTIGFMRLSDSAPLVLAQDMGFFTKYGLHVDLLREVSWANLRDKLVVGKLDAAHLLAPLPMMSTLGAGGMRANLITGLSLSLNGNAITLAGSHCERLQLDNQRDAIASAKALNGLLKTRGESLTLATVHAFSMHTLLLRHWLRAGEIDPDKDVRLIVLPPEQMCDSLARGIIDGFCVGEPWNTVAVQQGVGSVVAAGYDIWNNAPEKVLGVTEHWHDHHPATHLRLRLALMEACVQLRDPEHRTRAASILSRPEYLDLPLRQLLPSLTGLFSFAKNQEPDFIDDFHVFSRYQAGFPWRSHAQWMLQQCGPLLGKSINSADSSALAQRCYRTDLYREAARYLGWPSPSQDSKPENQHDSPWMIDEGVELGPDQRVGG